MDKKPIYFFYESTCHACDDLMEVLNDFVQTQDLEIETIDVSSKEGEDKYNEFERGLCGGVPFLYNPNNQKTVCGLVSKEEIIEFLK